ncbi:YncE family protein [uncultured Hyphomicrobium sp.]|uniref:YncE family protein n=1 Tax=uncultured Hyphomicrobium sp. TaxID=194373 RepID=UPI0025FA070C|nr:YncE family protein [uncultured Hyphomicrobium sp.]
MRRTLLAAYLLAVALLGEAHAAERTYVLSQAGAALSALDDGADKPSFSIALDKAPAALAFGAKDGLAYVTHPDLGKVSAVDVAARRVVRSIPVQGSPFGIAAAKDGRLYVGDWNGAHVSVLDAAGGVPEHRIEVGRAPAHVLLSPDERLLFVANRESDSVSVIRTADLTVAATIHVGRAPFAMALSPDAARLYIGNVQDGTVSVVDTGALAVAETLASGAMPYGAAVTPDGTRLLITNQQASTVAVLGKTDPAATRIKVGGYPEGIAINSLGTRAYVANWFSDDVSVLDLGNLSEIRRIKCPAGPRGVAVWNGGP